MHRTKGRWALFGVVTPFIMLVCVSCGGGGNYATQPPPPSPPVITSSLTATTTVGKSFSYQITASNDPTTYTATNLPAGLSVNTGTGLISGTPTSAGTANVTISATNSGGTGSATLVITINAQLTITVSCSPNVLQVPLPNLSFPSSQCNATVQGTGSVNPAVTWQADQGNIGGTTGLYTPPNVTVQTVATITAASVQDPTQTGTATITIKPMSDNCPSDGKPALLITPPQIGAGRIFGLACNVDPGQFKVVAYALTNQWYVQPFANAPYTSIANDGSWTMQMFPWDVVVALLVDPTKYTPAATKIMNPMFDSNVTASAMFPDGQASVNFSGRTWIIKMTGTTTGYVFDPGPNPWSNDPAAVNVTPDGELHLKIIQINGFWACAEVVLPQSLGYGTYTIQVDSHLDGLDKNTVAAPLFIYVAPGEELDNEYSGLGGLILDGFTAQIVAQPFTVPGNIVRYTQPSTGQFTTQMVFQPDHVLFTTWNGWASTPASGDIIQQFNYTGANIPPVDGAFVHINLWLFNGSAPTNGVGDSMTIKSFTFQP